jgi:hypothetical protein
MKAHDRSVERLRRRRGEPPCFRMLGHRASDRVRGLNRDRRYSSLSDGRALIPSSSRVEPTEA